MYKKKLPFLFIFILLHLQSFSKPPVTALTVVSLRQVVDPVGLGKVLQQVYGFKKVENALPYVVQMKRDTKGREFFLKEQNCFRQKNFVEGITVQQVPHGYFVQITRSKGEDVFNGMAIDCNEHGVCFKKVDDLPEIHVVSEKRTSIVTDFSKVVKKVRRFVEGSSKNKDEVRKR